MSYNDAHTRTCAVEIRGRRNLRNAVEKHSSDNVLKMAGPIHSKKKILTVVERKENEVCCWAS